MESKLDFWRILSALGIRLKNDKADHENGFQPLVLLTVNISTQFPFLFRWVDQKTFIGLCLIDLQCNNGLFSFRIP